LKGVEKMKNKVKIKDEEAKFFEALKEVFIGEEIEGESGYINLMGIKSKYFDKIFKILNEEIEEKTREFPEFKKELFDKLYSFFKRYFSESGSIYFRHTPFSERIFERVYTENKDVVMFWKTNMLYYVKTDIHPKNMEVFINGTKFFFDVSKLQPKKAWEKRQLIYELKEIKNSKIVFYVYYSERGRKTKTKEILRQLKEKGISIDEETLERAFRVFEKQNEVDYFICKNAKKFLKEQFDLWLYQYVHSDETQFTPGRIKQLKGLKEIAYKIIDFISQFEDELVKIWQKPKFVLNSNYVVTLDRIAEKEKGIEVIEKILDHPNFEKQVKEWKELGIISDEFDPKEIFTTILEGKSLNPNYQYLPIDTKYFKDSELEILSLFDNLDEELDGWLIKSENWQALNTILPKFKEKVQLIYIDPPFNTGSNEFTMYINRFLDSAWITMMENRLRLAKDILKDTGSIYVRIDYHGNHYVRFLMDDIFGKENFRNEIIVNRSKHTKEATNIFLNKTEYFIFYAKSPRTPLNPLMRKKDVLQAWDIILKQVKTIKRDQKLFEKVSKQIEDSLWLPFLHLPGEQKQNPERKLFGITVFPPKGRHWAFSQEKLDRAIKEKRVRLRCVNCGYLHYEGAWEKCPKCGKNEPVPEIFNPFELITTNWTDIPGYYQDPDFPTRNSEEVLSRVIQASSNPGDLVMDFFLGSGTTTAVAHKLGRKWIGIEMGDLSARNKNEDYFYTITFARMKKVLAGEQSGISKEVGWKGGGFFKYYELEQYEDTLNLKRVKYADADPFFDPTQDPYNQYIFMKDLKLLEALEIDYENKKVKVNLERLYQNIDIAEILSNLLGKWIKRIGEDFVEFEDSEKIDIRNLDYKLVKPLVWWE